MDKKKQIILFTYLRNIIKSIIISLLTLFLIKTLDLILTYNETSLNLSGLNLK